jgi:two-component system response regulator TctD
MDSGFTIHHIIEAGSSSDTTGLLQALMARPGQAMAKERLFERVFPGASDVQHEAVEVVVYRLRKKLAPTGVELVTLRGLGYLLKASAPA